MDFNAVIESELKVLDDQFSLDASIKSIDDNMVEFMHEMYEIDPLDGLDVYVPMKNATRIFAFDVRFGDGDEIMRLTAGHNGDFFKKATQKYGLIKIWHSRERNDIVFVGGSPSGRADAAAYIINRMHHNLRRIQARYLRTNRFPR